MKDKIVCMISPGFASPDELHNFMHSLNYLFQIIGGNGLAWDQKTKDEDLFIIGYIQAEYEKIWEVIRISLNKHITEEEEG